MVELSHKWFVNDFNRSLVLGRTAGYRQGIMFRVQNKTQYSMTPLIGVGENFTETTSYLTGTTIVPDAFCDIVLPAVDSNGDQFTEKYVFLDYADVSGDVLGLGLEFSVMQDSEFRLLYFVDEGVSGAFDS